MSKEKKLHNIETKEANIGTDTVKNFRAPHMLKEDSAEVQEIQTILF